MAKYNVTAEVTISVTATIEANSKAEALEKARHLEMPDLCYQCSSEEIDQWCVDSIDGTAQGAYID